MLDEKRLLTLLDLGKVLESKDFEKIWKVQDLAKQNIQKLKEEKESVKEKVAPTKHEENIKPVSEDQIPKTSEKEEKTEPADVTIPKMDESLDIKKEGETQPEKVSIKKQVEPKMNEKDASETKINKKKNFQKSKKR